MEAAAAAQDGRHQNIGGGQLAAAAGPATPFSHGYRMGERESLVFRLGSFYTLELLLSITVCSPEGVDVSYPIEGCRCERPEAGRFPQPLGGLSIFIFSYKSLTDV